MKAHLKAEFSLLLIVIDPAKKGFFNGQADPENAVLFNFQRGQKSLDFIGGFVDRCVIEFEDCAQTAYFTSFFIHRDLPCGMWAIYGGINDRGFLLIYIAGSRPIIIANRPSKTNNLIPFRDKGTRTRNGTQLAFFAFLR